MCKVEKISAGMFSYKPSLIAAMPNASLTHFAILLHHLAGVLGFEDVQFALRLRQTVRNGQISRREFQYSMNCRVQFSFVQMAEFSSFVNDSARVHASFISLHVFAHLDQLLPSP